MSIEKSLGESSPTPPQELIFGRRFRALVGAVVLVGVAWSCSGLALLMNFWFIRVGAVAVAIPVLLISPGMIADFFSDFNTDGISRPTLRGRRFIRWSEIRRIKKSTAGIIVRSARHQLVFRYSSFRDPQALVAEIERRVAPSALASDQELRSARVASGRAVIAAAAAPATSARAALRVAAIQTSILSLLMIMLLLWITPGSGMLFLPGIAIGGACGLLAALANPWLLAASFSRPTAQPLQSSEIADREALIRLRRPWPILVVGSLFALVIAAYAIIGGSYVEPGMESLVTRATTADAIWHRIGLAAGGVLAFMLAHATACAATYVAILRASRPLAISREEVR